MRIELTAEINTELAVAMSVIRPVLDFALEGDGRVEFIGAFSRTGSPAAQMWHSDCTVNLYDTVDPSIQLPPHCVTMFIPLVPHCGKREGCTEFLAGSHHCPVLNRPNALLTKAPSRDAFDHLPGAFVPMNLSKGTFIGCVLVGGY